MSQKNILNYFKPSLIEVANGRSVQTNSKKDSKCVSKVSDNGPNVKKQKLDKENDGMDQNTIKNNQIAEDDEKKALSLSPDQKNLMAENKLKAQVKRQSQQCPALHETIGVGWFEALKEQFDKPYFLKLSSFLKCQRASHTIYPPLHQVYSWTNYCDIKDVKVVILGQDPYHGVGQAHGLCFSVQRGVPPPPSLVNMYKELEKDIAGFKHPGHGYLVGWAKQGVLLLNACLTVQANKANSHKDQGWESFTDAVIKAVSVQNKDVVFLLWGAYAQKKAAAVDKKKHHLLPAPHPSPLSAHRGFLGCHHFSKCNELLQKHGKSPIDWCYLPLE